MNSRISCVILHFKRIQLEVGCVFAEPFFNSIEKQIAVFSSKQLEVFEHSKAISSANCFKVKLRLTILHRIVYIEFNSGEL